MSESTRRTNAKITIVGTQYINGNKNGAVTRTECDGLQAEREGKCFVFFDEITEDGEKVSTTIKFDKSSVEMLKKGAYNTRMIFEKGVITKSDYVTPFGTLLMEIDTKMMSLQILDGVIVCTICYSLSANGTESFINELTISVEKNARFL